MSIPNPVNNWTSVPQDVTDYGVLDYGDLVEVALRRNINRASRQRYINLLPQIVQDWDVLLAAIENSDVGLFRTWMDANNGEVENYSGDGTGMVEVLQAFAKYEPRFLDVALGYPAFGQSLKWLLDLSRHSTGGSDEDFYTNLQRFVEQERPLITNEVETDLLREVLRAERLRNEFILPELARNPFLLINSIIPSLNYDDQGAHPQEIIRVVDELLDLMQQNRIPLRDRDALAEELMNMDGVGLRGPLVREWRRLAERVRRYPNY